MGILRPNTQRANVAVIMVIIVMGLNIISVISGIMQYNLLKAIANGGAYTDSSIAQNDLRERIVGIAILIAYITSCVTFIRWFRRAYYNLGLLTQTSYSDGWAAGVWFIPIVCLYRPYQIMRELYQYSSNYFENKNINEGSNISTAHLPVWWTLWIVTNVISQFAFRLQLHANTIEDITSYTIIDIISNSIEIPLAIVTIFVIRKYSKVEPMLNDQNDISLSGSYN